MLFFNKPTRRKLDQYLQEHRKDPEVALSEMTRLSHRVWKLVIGLLVSTLFFILLLVPQGTNWNQKVFLGILVFLVNGLGWATLLQVQPRLFDRPSTYNQFIVLLLLTVGTSKLIFIMPSWSAFLVPLPLMAMIVTMVYGQSVAMLIVIGVGFYLSLLSPRLWNVDLTSLSGALEFLKDQGGGSQDLNQLIFPALARADIVLGVSLILGSIVCVILVKKIRHQSRPTLVGALAGGVQGFVVMAFQVIDPQLSYPDMGKWDWNVVLKFLTDPAWAFAGGLLSGAMLTVSLPAIERVLGIVTERRLLALSDPNNELLRTLLNRAPGTYQHTLGVAQLARLAAEAIGADPLLAQVGAYYHDIGKIVKPEYFVENMGEDKSIHSRLRPSMSKLVIISHVKEGIELAWEAKLPNKIIDMIPMHHGTTVVEYFFHKALEQGNGETKETEAEYRYPGPRPRFPEAGILLLADTVEAAAKSIAEPNTNRFKDMVREIVQKRLLDGQLDECGLTIKDLRRIEDSFVRTLTNMYHGRIRYPSAEGPGREEVSPPAAADEATEVAPERKQNGGGRPTKNKKLVPSAQAGKAT